MPIVPFFEGFVNEYSIISIWKCIYLTEVSERRGVQMFFDGLQLLDIGRMAAEGAAALNDLLFHKLGGIPFIPVR